VPSVSSFPGRAKPRGGARCTGVRDAVVMRGAGPLPAGGASTRGWRIRYVGRRLGVPFRVSCALHGGTGLKAVSGAGTGSPPSVRPALFHNGRALTAVRRAEPGLGRSTRPRAYRSGNVSLWGITVVQKERVLRRPPSIVTVAEIGMTAPEPWAIWAARLGRPATCRGAPRSASPYLGLLRPGQTTSTRPGT